MTMKFRPPLSCVLWGLFDLSLSVLIQFQWFWSFWNFMDTHIAPIWWPQIFGLYIEQQIPKVWSRLGELTVVAVPIWSIQLPSVKFWILKLYFSSAQASTYCGQWGFKNMGHPKYKIILVLFWMIGCFFAILQFRQTVSEQLIRCHICCPGPNLPKAQSSLDSKFFQIPSLMALAWLGQLARLQNVTQK